MTDHAQVDGPSHICARCVLVIAANGLVGYQFFEDPQEFEYLVWTAGLSYIWKSLTFDVRYWDTNLSDSECVVRSGFLGGCDARVVGTISLDLTWSALKGRGL